MCKADIRCLWSIGFQFQYSYSEYLYQYLIYLCNYVSCQICVQRPSWDPKTVAVIDRWSLFICCLCYKNWNLPFKMVVFEGRWLLFRGGRYVRFDWLRIVFGNFTNIITWSVFPSPAAKAELKFSSSLLIRLSAVPWTTLLSSVFWAENKTKLFWMNKVKSNLF